VCEGCVWFEERAQIIDVGKMPDCGAEMKENEVRITFALVGDVCEMARDNCFFL